MWGSSCAFTRDRPPVCVCSRQQHGQHQGSLREHGQGEGGRGQEEGRGGAAAETGQREAGAGGGAEEDGGERPGPLPQPHAPSPALSCSHVPGQSCCLLRGRNLTGFQSLAPADQLIYAPPPGETSAVCLLTEGRRGGRW